MAGYILQGTVNVLLGTTSAPAPSEARPAASTSLCRDPMNTCCPLPSRASGQPPPTSKPQAVRQDDFEPFDGELVEQRTTEDGIEYLRVVRRDDSSSVPMLPRAPSNRPGARDDSALWYLAQVFGGAQPNGEPSRVIDAEFAFIPNDNIITLRAASRVQPGGLEGKLKLSFTDSPLVLDANYSK